MGKIKAFTLLLNLAFLMPKQKLHLEISPYLLWEYDLATFDFDQSIKRSPY
jgi:hypothetical protein